MQCVWQVFPGGFRCVRCWGFSAIETAKDCPGSGPGEFSTRATETEGAPAALDCRLRSGPPELILCRPCESAGRLPLVFSCPLYGRVTLHKLGFREQGKTLPACLTCSDRDPSES